MSLVQLELHFEESHEDCLDLNKPCYPNKTYTQTRTCTHARTDGWMDVYTVSYDSLFIHVNAFHYIYTTIIPTYISALFM